MLGVVFCAIELLRKTYKMLGTHLTSSFDLPFGNFWTKKFEIFVTLKIYSVWNPDTLRSDTRKTSDTLKKLTRGFGPFFILHFNCHYGTLNIKIYDFLCYFPFLPFPNGLKNT